MKKLFLLCNAHLDPVWQWDLAEGKSVTLSTFASVVDLLEKYDFVFCHNESVLYKWVEEYSPELFERIRKLIKAGKWKIMGGWYIQPDCNMPTAESITRQALVGKKYFAEKFGVDDIETAINLDSFGHSAGLPKLLNSLGYTSYIGHRPMECFMHLPFDFIWEGLGGGKLIFSRPTSYNSLLGEAAQKIEAEIKLAESENREEALVLWGVGNHGGGPSRKDLQDIAAMARDKKDIEFKHIWPERYFKEIKDKQLPIIKGDLNPCFVGCYTSQAEVKHLHRDFENMFYETEKLASCAALNGVCEYPEKELDEIQEILLFSQFHDILPGTTVRGVTKECLRLMGEGINRLRNVQAKCMFKLAEKNAKAAPMEYPVFVFNPCPYPVKTYIENPVLMAERFMSGFADLEVYGENGRVKAQVIKEDSSIPIEWAKKVVFEAELKPFSLTRFDIKCKHYDEKPVLKQPDGDIVTENCGRKITIGKNSGLIESFVVNGKELLSGAAFNPAIYDDNEDPWAMQMYQQKRLGIFEKYFSLATPEENARISGLKVKDANPVRIIEDGEVYTVVEAIFVADTSYIITQYKIHKTSDDVIVNMEVHFDHKDKMVKVEIPTNNLDCVKSQILGGELDIVTDGSEKVCHKWISASDGENSLAILNDCIYGFSAEDATIKLSLLRGVAYTAHFISDDRPILRNDRYNARVDQGVSFFTFKLTGGSALNVENTVTRAALELNEKPIFQNIFPQGNKNAELCGVELSGDSRIVMTAFKRMSDGRYAIRLTNQSNAQVSGEFKIKDASVNLNFDAFDIKSLIYDGETLTISEKPLI